MAEEFSRVYVFHLRGNQRTSGELSRKEGGKIFGSGSRAPIAISILIKNPKAAEHGQIYMHDIGDYLSREDKLAKVNAFKSIDGITKANGWLPITPDKHHDWVGQRDSSFSEFISLGDKKDKGTVTVFENYSSGVKTNRDAWCYNFSKNSLVHNMKNMIDFYNHEMLRYKAACKGLTEERYPDINDFINADSTKISWNRGFKNDLARFVFHEYQENGLVTGVYRPFTKNHVYFSKHMNDMIYQMPRIFPDATADNRVICVTGRGETVGFSALIVDKLPNLHTIASGQCFPLKLYEKNSAQDESLNSGDVHDDLFEKNQKISINTDAEYTIKDGITNAGLIHFQSAYPTEPINKEDVFYYIYGLLHSEDYKKRYADNLSKELPRIPCVKKASDFWTFSQAGRDLAELHINYESVESYPVNFAGGELFMGNFSDADYRVEQMKFGKKNKETDKSTVIYNHKITMTHIPLDAYEYVVNGKPALEWVMERQAVTRHKESGIVNDANNWAIETMHDAAYPLILFRRVITVSLKTMEIVKNLPRLDIAVSQA
ncbi:hypothetical protein C8R34_10586 [Nitrosomonas sp. Nm84]|uniref:type ISP restriction/modification enzyme n=1 Tax=Nitrosomonas sp. Nm84 TaxID=200124 RepID=UPI000D90E668|nr:type ISP restriction/modification enzyme [Nitrosomonas sp. Nm84]PXW89106.1 hypothetical protein C8R34_10586 [Nitrosomonas sp. Nm84]